MLISYRERGRQGTGAGHRRSGSQTSAVSKEDEEKEGCKPDSKGNKTQGWEEKKGDRMAFQNSTIGPQAGMNLKGEGGGGHTRKIGTREGKEIKPQIILITATIHWGLPATTDCFINTSLPPCKVGSGDCQHHLRGGTQGLEKVRKLPKSHKE